MEESSLQDRLRNHAEAFDGLLSLIPAKMYYGEDNSDQWTKRHKKQSKEEKAAALMARLDPDNDHNRTAKDVMDDRARNKRKRQDIDEEDEEADDDDEDEDEDEDDADGDASDREKPGQGLKKASARQAEPTNKKRKTAEETGAKKQEKLERKAAKKAAKKEKSKEKKKLKHERLYGKETEGVAEEKVASAISAEAVSTADKEVSSAKLESTATKSAPRREETAAKKALDSSLSSASTRSEEKPAAKGAKPSSNKEPKIEAVEDIKAPAEEEEDAWESENSESESDDEAPDADMHPLGLQGLEKTTDSSNASSPPSAPHSPTFDTTDSPANPSTNEAASASTSIASTVPPSEKPKLVKVPADTTALRARLQARIAELRAARKADGPDGKPVKTRQELIEQRRQKQAERKATKKEQRRQAKLEEERQREEQLAMYSPMSPATELEDPANLSFGRVAFGDGSRLSRDLGHVVTQAKKKGPSDPKTALLKLQNQKKRLAGLDKEKQDEVEEKESWLAARRRAEGEKVITAKDESLLKKAVKRKDQAKKKTERKWEERARGVEVAQKERQRKREENIKKRKDDKIMKKIGKKAKKSAKGGRPGFEGVGFGGGSRRK